MPRGLRGRGDASTAATGRLVATTAEPPLARRAARRRRAAGGPVRLRGRGLGLGGAAPARRRPPARRRRGGPGTTRSRGLALHRRGARRARPRLRPAGPLASPRPSSGSPPRRGALGAGDLSARAGRAGARRGRRARPRPSTRWRRGSSGWSAPSRSCSPTSRTSCARRSPGSGWRSSSPPRATWSGPAATSAEIGTDLDELDRLVEDVLTAARLDAGRRRGGACRSGASRWTSAGGGGATRRERFRERAPGANACEARRGRAPGRSTPTRRCCGGCLDNLLDNAAKYSEAPAPVDARGARRAGGRWCSRCATGASASTPQDLPRLFTPFFRTDRSRARGTGGVGLGLALARRIAEAHGGDDRGGEPPGEGTTFRVRLPAAPRVPGGAARTER